MCTKGPVTTIPLFNSLHPQDCGGRNRWKINVVKQCIIFSARKARIQTGLNGRNTVTGTGLKTIVQIRVLRSVKLRKGNRGNPGKRRLHRRTNGAGIDGIFRRVIAFVNAG